MRLKSISLFPYRLSLLTGGSRSGFFLRLTDDQNQQGWGEIAPLPGRSFETPAMALEQLRQKKELLLATEWPSDYFDMYPSVSFAVESALLSLLSSIPIHQNNLKNRFLAKSAFHQNFDSSSCFGISAFFMGSVQEILSQAERRAKEGYISAKVKVGSLSPQEALVVINALKGHFRLRIDVNRAWPAAQALPFFSQFSKEDFDYVEEPFSEPHLLSQFPLPLAVDESFPTPLSQEALESLPTLRAIIYKPTLQGGLSQCLPLYDWATSRGIDFVFGSSFESDLGLRNIAAMAHRLCQIKGASLPPLGIGTVHSLPYLFCEAPFPQLSPPIMF